MQKQNLIRYFLLMVTITLVGCQTNPPVTETRMTIVKRTDVTGSLPNISQKTPPQHTQRTCWTEASQPIKNRGRQTFILAMGANIGDLRKANDDAVQFKEAMKKRFEVPKEHICLLKDVYRAEFERALEDLNYWVKSDDRVIIFFSGHGSFVKDNDGDEKSNHPDDNRDEVFVTLDVEDLEDPNRKNVVADDDFAKLVNALPTKRIITFIDACHSGGMNKGKKDDTVSQMRVKWFSTPIGTVSPSLYHVASQQTAGGLEGIKGVVLAATQEKQFACENDEGGIFTTTFLKYIKHKPEALFEKLFQYTKIQMQQSQVPCDKYIQIPDMIGEFLSGD